MQLSARAAHGLLAAVAILAAAPPALADRASGEWSGSVEIRGDYYWERSTRVVAPEVGVEAESPSGVRVRGNYLVDTITSASVAAGALTDTRFTEIRHDITLGVGYEFDLDGAQLDLTVDGRYGYEPDYQSTGTSLGAAVSMNERTTIFRLGATYVHDVVGKLFRGANRTAMGRDLSDRGVQGELDAFVLNLGYEQVLTPHLVLGVGYDLGILEGYQHNAYRRVVVNGTPLDELHPSSRTRHNGHARLAWYLPSTGTALHAMYRAYLDTWDIGALTPEARVYQEIGDLVMLRLRYRYYTQTRAFFQRPDGDYTSEDEYYTDDPKMSEFDSHLLGTMLLVHLEFLDQTPLDFAWEASLEFIFEYMWSSSSYGDAIIAQAALRLPF